MNEHKESGCVVFMRKHKKALKPSQESKRVVRTNRDANPKQ
jgi:hypothetical protein